MAIAPQKNRHTLEENPKAPVGPPFLLGIPLYDARDEELHDVIDRFSVQLDRATSIDVLLELVGNPRELHSLYESLRSDSLAKKDAADAAVYARKLRLGQGPSHVRRIEVDKLVQYLQIPREQLPCIAFLPFPLSLPVGIFAVKPKWISTPEAGRRFGAALEEFFESGLDIREMLKGASTNVELVLLFQSHMNKWFAKRMKDCQAKPQKKRASRAAAIDTLKTAIRDHICSARDHAQTLIENGKEPKLLPRPKQQLLAEQLHLSRSTVSRALRDSHDRELILLWQAADDLEQTLHYKR